MNTDKILDFYLSSSALIRGWEYISRLAGRGPAPLAYVLAVSERIRARASFFGARLATGW
jgi:hypothetical protein